jgi:hypothetical protein
MTRLAQLKGIVCLAAAASLSAALLGCTHERFGPVSQHYIDFHTEAPRNNTVYVCHAYGCRMQTAFRFTDADIAQLKTLMTKTRKADTPYEERRAVAYAIGWMEKSSAPAPTDRAWILPAVATRPNRTASTRRPIPRATC